MTRTQLDLFDSTARREIVRARATDPSTSKAAARRSHRLAAEHFQKILAALRSSATPLCAHEIASRCGLESLQVSRRMAELCGPEIAGAEAVDQLGVSEHGRAATRWRALLC